MQSLAIKAQTSQKIEPESRVCTRCVSDTTIPGIRFDEQGVCQYCKMYEELDRQFPQGEAGQQQLEQLAAKIKVAGKNKRYDCVVGVSGGRDSTYTLYLAVKLGLRPLAVHFDNGWNSEIAVSNIKNATTILDVDLHTIVADWEEFKDLQVAFLKASVSDADIPTDVAIFGTLHQAAAEENIHYILNGHSFRTEGLMPIGWTYMDGKYIDSVYKLFGKYPRLKSVPNFTMFDFIYYTFIKRIKTIPILNYVKYDQAQIDHILETELGWTYYGGHHHESYYTHFFQSFYLPKKFNIDKRKIEYSALVLSGQMDRAAALKEITENEYPFDEELVSYTIKKLGISPVEFEDIMTGEPKSFHDYPTYYPLIKRLNSLVKIAADLNLVSKLLYLKYSG